MSCAGSAFIPDDLSGKGHLTRVIEGPAMLAFIELPPGFDASELLIHVKERGVLFAPGRYFYVQAPLPNTLRLGFASLDEKQIARGVATLAELLKIEMRKRQRGVRRAERSRVALV